MPVSESSRPTTLPSPNRGHRRAAFRLWNPTLVPAIDDRQAAGRSAGRRTWHSRYLQRLVPMDIASGVGGGLIGVSLIPNGPARIDYLLAVPGVVLAWLTALVLADAYGRRRLTIGSEQMRAVGRAAVLVVSVVAVCAYVVGVSPSRDFVFTVVIVLSACAVLARLVLRRWLRARRAQGELMQRTVVVGRADAARALVQSLTADRSQGLLPVAVCASDVDGAALTGADIADVPVVGAPEAAIAACDLVDAEVVAVAAHPDLAGPALRRLAWELEDRGVELIVAPGLLDVAGPRLSIRPSQNLSLLHVERPSAARLHVWVKSVMDRCCAALLLLALAPLLAVTAMAVRLGDGGPVIFRQERIGVRGEPFWMYKFRTMSCGAESSLTALVAASDGNGVLFKMHDDPRVTVVGRFLRRFSLDELPQLVNVLLGDMSLVGPRPPLPAEVDQYEADALRRLRVKPGMTGLWQVSGRSDLSWEESLRLDLHYVDNWSPMGDLHILLRTVNAVVRGAGAY